MNFSSRMRELFRRKKKFVFAETTNTLARKERIFAFVENVCDVEEVLFVSDESTIWDFDSGPVDGAQLIERIQERYRVQVTRHMLDWPLWELVDRVNSQGNDRSE